MNILPHPIFLGKWKRMFFWAIAYFVVTVGGVIYLGNHEFRRLADVALWFVLISNVLLFVALSAMPFVVRCAYCRGKTVTKLQREECPDTWSAHCVSCDVIWNLELGNSD
jgi:hypothetical protein